MDQFNQTSPEQTTNTPPVNNAPVFNSTPSTGLENNHKKIGPIVTTLVIVLLLIIAGIYIFASKVNQQIVPASDTTADATNQKVSLASSTTVTPITNTKDDLNSLQSDLNTSTTGIDAQSF